MKPSLDVVVVNWNARELLRAALASLTGALDKGFELRRVVVVDNASTDGSLEGLEHLGLPIEVLRNAENRGFGRACNQGARASEADYVLFLNPDTRLFADSLSVPLAFLERPENAGVAVAGIQLVGDDGRVSASCARFPRAATFLWIATGLDRIFARRGLGYRMTEWDHAESRDVDHVMGAFYLVRRRVFAELGGFDEDFFVYFEDLDLSRRVAAAGYRSRFLAEARAYHQGGGTSRRIKARRLSYFLRGKLRYAQKHHTGAAALAATAATLLVEPLCRSLGALLVRRPAELVETLGAYALLLRAEPAGEAHG